MAIQADWRRLHELRVAARGHERLDHAPRERGTEEAVVLAVEPQLADAARAAIARHRLDELLLAADIVGAAPAASSGGVDDADEAPQRRCGGGDRSDSAGRLSGA